MLESLKFITALTFFITLISTPIGYKFIRLYSGAATFDSYFEFAKNFKTYKVLYQSSTASMLIYYLTMLSAALFVISFFMGMLVFPIDEALGGCEELSEYFGTPGKHYRVVADAEMGELDDGTAIARMNRGQS